MPSVHLGGLRFRTIYEVECWRKGKWLWTERFHNLVVTTGLNQVLDAAFGAGLAVPAWYVGLVANTGFSAYASADTMASHAGWTESTIYSDATRPAFTPGAVAGGLVDNAAARANFTINSSAALRGAFLANNSTKGGATGTLYGAGDFLVQRTPQAGDLLLVKATLTAVSV